MFLQKMLGVYKNVRVRIFDAVNTNKLVKQGREVLHMDILIIFIKYFLMMIFGGNNYVFSIGTVLHVNFNISCILLRNRPNFVQK